MIEEQERTLCDHPSPQIERLFFDAPVPMNEAPCVISSDLTYLMEKVSSEILIMQVDGISSTTFVLPENPNISSYLQGIEIQIDEFSTARNDFNIKIKGSFATICHISSHIPLFMKLFRERKFDFSINRIDMELSEEKGFLFSEDEQGSKHQ